MFELILSAYTVVAMKCISYPISPIPAPRMTRSDKWKKRPCVLRFFAFRDEVRARKVGITAASKVIFNIEMPASWSKQRRVEWDGLPHMNKPDIDNLIKALLDSVFEDDAHIWAVSAEKRWAITPSIVVCE